MRIVHSLWAKPMQSNRWFLENQLPKSVWLYGLSLHYAQKITDEVVLYTDKVGSEYLSCLPYTEIIDYGNELNTIDPKWWAYGKIKAIEKEPLGSIHIDGDVFLKSEKILPVLKKKADVVCQMLEKGGHFEGAYIPQFRYFKKVCSEELMRHKQAFNGGVFGFFCEELKGLFLQEYKSLIDRATSDVGIMRKMDGKYEPNIMAEQWLVSYLAEKLGSRVNFILDPIEVDKRNSLNAVADELGFVHAWGKVKYEEAFLNKVKSILKQENYKLYKKIKDYGAGI